MSMRVKDVEKNFAELPRIFNKLRYGERVFQYRVYILFSIHFLLAEPNEENFSWK